MSPEIVNECILLMSTNCVVRRILNKIHDVKFFAILADETRDAQNKEQLTTCIRWVDDQLDIHEDFIGLVHVEQSNAKSLYLAINIMSTFAARCHFGAVVVIRDSLDIVNDISKLISNSPYRTLVFNRM